GRARTGYARGTGSCTLVVERQNPLYVAAVQTIRSTQLVLLGQDQFHAKLQKMLTETPGRVVTQCISGDGIHPRCVSGIDVKAMGSVGSVGPFKEKRRHLSAKPRVKNRADWSGRKSRGRWSRAGLRTVETAAAIARARCVENGGACKVDAGARQL